MQIDICRLEPWTLIHPVSRWTHWATLRRHSRLLTAADRASSQVSPIFSKSFFIMTLQFVLGRPGPLLYPGTSRYNAWCGGLWWSILSTWRLLTMQAGLLDQDIFELQLTRLFFHTESHISITYILNNVYTVCPYKHRHICSLYLCYMACAYSQNEQTL